ncbi:MAG: DUF4349 domain-containing protein [Actinomycetales bacterium]|nr:DUF4349 domain-containing protein [Actinomycetales bacterium]
MAVRVRPRSTRTRTPAARARLAGVGAAALALGVLLGGCSGGGSASSGAMSSQPMEAVPAPAADGSAGGAVAKDGTRSSAGGTVGAPLSTIDRSIIVRADVAVRVADVPRSTGDLGALATAHHATIASQTTSSGTTPTPLEYPTRPDGSTACPSTGCPTPYASSTTTLRVANSEVDALLADVARLGTVEATTRTSDDVTAQVADVDARVRNAEASLARVRALMTRATSIGDVVALEGELSKRQADLEALEASQRALADQTAQATVTVRLLSTDAPAPAPADETGFLAGLRAGWAAFTDVVSGTLTVVGALVPFLFGLVPVGLVVWAVLRRRRHLPAPVDQGA